MHHEGGLSHHQYPWNKCKWLYLNFFTLSSKLISFHVILRFRMYFLLHFTIYPSSIDNQSWNVRVDLIWNMYHFCSWNLLTCFFPLKLHPLLNLYLLFCKNKNLLIPWVSNFMSLLFSPSPLLTELSYLVTWHLE